MRSTDPMPCGHHADECDGHCVICPRCKSDIWLEGQPWPDIEDLDHDADHITVWIVCQNEGPDGRDPLGVDDGNCDEDVLVRRPVVDGQYGPVEVLSGR